MGRILIAASATMAVLCAGSGSAGAQLPEPAGGTVEEVCELLGGCATCQGDLDQCRSELRTCDDDLATCDDDLATCNDALDECQFLPATGQTTAFTADKNDGITGPVAVPDDGTVQAGAPLAYVDNGDGTVTDLNTGLMWEKKGGDGGLHDKDNQYPWSGDGTEETIWDWLDDVNAENGTGFAGYDDWRIPNVRELQTIASYGVVTPSVDPAFHDGCVADCSNTACSCTVSSIYWSATTHASIPTFAWRVSFVDGNVNATDGKRFASFVRAVRGGSQ